MQPRFALRDRRDTDQVVRGIVSDVKGCEPSSVRLDAKLMAEMGDDSLDLLHFCFQLERAFDVQIGEVSRTGIEQMLREDPQVSIRDFVDEILEPRRRSSAGASTAS
jgi:acyl carrier protein